MDLIIQNAYHQAIKMYDSTYSYIEMNTVKNFTTIHLRLNWIDTLNDVSNKVCFPNKTEDLNLSVFNMMTGVNESKTLTKHISYECK